MARLYYDADADPSVIAGRKVAIIGYGSQVTPTLGTSLIRASMYGWACGPARPRRPKRPKPDSRLPTWPVRQRRLT